MNILRWALFAGLLVLAVVSVASYVASRRGGTTASKPATATVYYCPMHPSYTSDRPGECPICGMALEPMKATAAESTAAAHGPSVPGLAEVHMTPDRIQLIGVRTMRVEKRPLGGGLELVGFIAPDEGRIKRVQIRVSGWIQQLGVSRTGDRVTAGQPLLSIYSPELYQSEREYLIERPVRDSMPGMQHEQGAAATSTERLRLLGVPDEEIRRLERERTASQRLTLRSPVTGTVLERNVVEGQYVGADTPLLTLADLSRVWVLADLYEMDYSRVQAGDRVRFTSDALPGRSLEGKVDFVYPTVSPETRTLKIRVTLPNSDGQLRPGMYGRVMVAGAGRPALAVPSEAVINTGERNYVFVARAGGHFDPRAVEVGVRQGDWTQILKGLAEGDTVVASGSFLIDSESRLKAAISGTGMQGMDMGEPGAAATAPPAARSHGGGKP